MSSVSATADPCPPAARARPGPPPPPVLVGRDGERRLLDARVAEARSGLSAALVVRGDAGIGKTALVADAVTSATGVQVVQVAGVESEMELPYAALHRLLLPSLPDAPALPGPQHDALSAAFGLIPGPVPDRFLIGLGTLTLLAGSARATPLLCVIDDAQWLDQASLAVLIFVARRLFADGIAMFFCVRDAPEYLEPFSGLPELCLRGLAEAHCLDLLGRLAGPVDRHVAQRIMTAAGGNPLALAEFARELTPAQLSGDELASGPLPLSDRLEARYLRQVRALTPAAQQMLLLAAADPSGDPVLLDRAAAQVGLSPADLGEEISPFLTLQPAVAFRHQLIRSAVYGGCAAAARRVAHRALAQVTDQAADPDRWSWHLAAATLDPDDDIAVQLERCAGRARGRGGFAAESAFLTRAAELTPDPERRGARLLAAAEAALAAADYQRCLALLAWAEPLLSGVPARAQAARIRGACLGPLGHTADAPAVLAAAARDLEPFDGRLARDTWLGALAAAWLALGYTRGTTLTEIATRALVAPQPEPGRKAIDDLILDGLATRVAVGYTAAVPILRRAFADVDTCDLPVTEVTLQPLLCHISALELWDLDSGRTLLLRLAERNRAQGALLGLWLCLLTLSHKEAWAGRFAAGDAYYSEALAIGDAIGLQPLTSFRNIEADALRGRDDEVRASAASLMGMAEGVGGGSTLTTCRISLVLLDIGRGRYSDALAAGRLVFDEDAPGFGNQILPELVEAAVRAGDPGTARLALDRLATRALASGTSWARGVLARSRALLASADDAEAHHQDAIALLRQARMPLDQARAHLLYGEWLRREKRRSDAVSQLRTAHGMFASMSSAGFAERARIELRAAGARPGQHAAEQPRALTPQEEQVARLAARALTNREIATRLFISESTVAYHLRKVFRKLDVTSRRELARTSAASSPGEGGDRA
jgi:DNA-binding CsgD family transcriptional regulator